MSLIDDAALAETAKEIILGTGRTVTFVRFSEEVDDTAKPWRGTTAARSTPAETLETAATFVPPTGAGLGLKTLDAEWVKRSQQICLVAPGTSETADLSTFDELLDGVTRWKITGVETLKPQNVVLLYFVGVKR